MAAVGATAAHAAPLGFWKVGETYVSLTLSPTLKVSELEGKSLVLLSKVGGSKVEISCSGIEFIGVRLVVDGSLGNEGKIRLSGCVTKLNEKISAACEPTNGAEKGVIVSNTIKGALAPHEGSLVVQIQGSLSETIATVVSSETCTIGKSVALIGTLSLKDGAIKTLSTSHLFSGGPLSEAWLVSKTAEHLTTMDASIVLTLSGEDAGKEWRAVEAKASWTVNGSEVTSKLLPLLSIREIEGNDESLLSEVAKIKVEKLCTNAELIGAKLEPEGKVSAGAKVKFSGCVFKLNGTVTPACKPHSKGAEPGVIITNEAKGQLSLEGEEGILRLQPVTGEVLVTVELGEECAIGEQMPLIGKLVLTISKSTTEAKEHLVAGSALSELWLISKTEEHKVLLDGSGILELTGEHKGLAWRGIVE
ncbi:MAG TPA: hypothetical protein VNS60_13395 [Solirubrobacterales bacterium]|nr:hypothetical protein [Solirubrobacterales bacterium]